jgi:hypothetical protein
MKWKGRRQSSNVVDKRGVKAKPSVAHKLAELERKIQKERSKLNKGGKK